MTTLEDWLVANDRPGRRFEYASHAMPDDDAEIHRVLNLFGAHGWELVSLTAASPARTVGVNSVPTVRDWRATFRREVGA